MNPVTYLGRVAGNDVVLGSENVSRRHAKLVLSDAGLTVHDLDSHNGIFLNGKKVRSTPLAPGDLLYVGDVCIELRKNEDTELLLDEGTRVEHADITGEEDPSARSLAVLLRAARLAADADEASFPAEAVELCRELTEATVAALVLRDRTGQVETPVLMHPEMGRADAPVAWSVVSQVLDDGLAFFVADARTRPAVPGEHHEGAILCAPVRAEGRTLGAIYLSRPAAGPTFSERELDTVAGVGRLLAVLDRLKQGAAARAPLVAADAGWLAAQAKVEAAEARLQAALGDVRALTERTHALESENLKLRQSVELEKQNALEAKHEAERARVEATKLDQGLHKTDEEARKLKDAILRLEEERKARTTDVTRLKDAQRALETERERLAAEVEQLRRQSDQAASEIVRLQQDMHQAGETAARSRAVLEHEVGTVRAQQIALRTAMRQTLPPSVAEHVEHSIEGAPLVTDAVPRQVSALHLELFAIDSWAAKAAPAEVKARLDRFCAAVALRARANGGRIEQVLGHSHLVCFGADPPSVHAALRCGLEVSALLHDEGVVCGLHVGTTVSGFFGEGDSATRIEVGEAPALARALAGLAHTPTFYASDAVHKAAGRDPAFSLAMVGPARTPHGSTLLFTVEATVDARGDA